VDTRPEYYDAILNGLKVFKLQTYNTDSLAGPNPSIPQAVAVQSKRKSDAFVAGWAAAAVGLVAVLVGCLFTWAIFCRRKWKAGSDVVHVPEPVHKTPAPVLQGRTAYVFSVTAQK